MNPMDELQQINLGFQQLLATPQAAELSPGHHGDELVVWVLLGGKDVGKSTFLNALLGRQVSQVQEESVEGTQRFLAYIHRSAMPELEERTAGSAMEIRLHPHESEQHRRLCIIDSPDFDSRFERHASQVNQVLASGIADGAVLLASPEKYKNQQYWKAFQALSHTLSERHILFVLTKADELGEYLEEARSDFARTVERRMPRPLEPCEDVPSGSRGTGIYLIDSLKRGIDFDRLEGRLLRRLSAEDVRGVQADNLRHTVGQGAEQIREYYRLDQARELLRLASSPEHTEDICRDAFPEIYFHTVAGRLIHNREIDSAVRQRIWSRSGGTLAGVPAVLSALQWLSARNPFRLRSPNAPPPTEPEPGQLLSGLTRWGEEELDQRISLTQREVLSGIVPENPEALYPFLKQKGRILHTLAQRLEDLIAEPPGRLFSLQVLGLLNLPVALYLLFFVFLLLSPVFLLLKAWGVPHMPDYADILTLDNVKVAVIGFAGYYLMAFFYVIRKHRDQVRREVISLSERFITDMQDLVRQEITRPLDRVKEAFSRLEERLERAVLSRR